MSNLGLFDAQPHWLWVVPGGHCTGSAVGWKAADLLPTKIVTFSATLFHLLGNDPSVISSVFTQFCSFVASLYSTLLQLCSILTRFSVTAQVTGGKEGIAGGGGQHPEAELLHGWPRN